jgi:hypothetical protein
MDEIATAKFLCGIGVVLERNKVVGSRKYQYLSVDILTYLTKFFLWRITCYKLFIGERSDISEQLRDAMEPQR